MAIDAFEQRRRRAQRLLRLAAESGLQVRHQQSSRHTLTRNIGQQKHFVAAAGGEKIVVVTAHFARGQALGGALQCVQPRRIAGEQLLLHGGGDFQFRLPPPARIGLLANGRDQPLVLPRLLNEIARAAPHGFHRQIETAPRGHHHHRSGVALGLQAGQEIHALRARSRIARIVEVQQDQVEGLAARPIQQGGRRFHRHRLPALTLQKQPQRLADVRLVVAHQHPKIGKQRSHGFGSIHSRCSHIPMVARRVPFTSLFNTAASSTGDCPFAGRSVALWDGVRR